MAVKTKLINIIITGEGLTYYAEVVSEALRLTGAKVYTTPVNPLVVTFDILQTNDRYQELVLKAVLQALFVLFSAPSPAPITYLYF